MTDTDTGIRNNPEKVSNMQKTNPKSYKQRQGRKRCVRSYADMTIYAIGPATLMPKMCHHKLPTIIVTSLALSNV